MPGILYPLPKIVKEFETIEYSGGTRLLVVIPESTAYCPIGYYHQAFYPVAISLCVEEEKGPSVIFSTRRPKVRDRNGFPPAGPG
jgi:hypothetical protein